MAEEGSAAEVRRAADRRRFLAYAAAGTVVVALGGYLYTLTGPGDEEVVEANHQVLPDGRPRVPPGQRVIRRLKPMGGAEGDPSPSAFRLKVYGEVEHPFELDYAELLALPQADQVCDVHCVTRWSVLDSRWTGVRVADLAKKAKVRPGARHVIFEAAYGYTTNVPLDEALQPTVLVAHRLYGDPLESKHGSPVRALVPSLYFWKSAKWLTGIRFSQEDEPGYWEVRGYHNHGDPWNEERYS